MTLANLITWARIAVVPFFLLLMYGSRFSRQPAWAAFALFAAASLTDFVDGYLARRTGTVSRLGEFLDPLADKLLVGAALLTLTLYRDFPLWAALVIAVRELVVSVLRSTVHRRGRAMPASIQGKVKTAVQIPMVLLWMLPEQTPFGPIAVQDLAVVIVVFLTVISGITYFVKAKELLQS